MLQKKHIIYFLFLFIGLNSLCAQEEFDDYNFVSIKEGVSKRAVSSIIQDHYGFKWIGTNGAGLIRYDGIDYTSYIYDWNDESSINSNMIYCTYLDSENRLWVGTNSGLNLYNRSLNKFERIDLSVGNNTSANLSVQSMIQDNSGNLLLGTLNLGILSVEGVSLKVTKIATDIDKLDGFSINDLAKNRKGKIYAATNLGLMELDTDKQLLIQSQFSTESGLIKVKQPMESISIDDKDNLWLGTDVKGLIKLGKDNNAYQISAFSISNKRIMSLINTKDNRILCGTENDGLFVLNDQGEVLAHYLYNKFDKNSLRSNSIWSLYEDKDSRIWLGYFNKGVGVYDKLYSKFQTIESLASNLSSLQVGSVTGIVNDQSGKLWITMEGGGVDIYDPNTKEFKHVNSKNESSYRGLDSDDLQTVLVDSNENVWLGSWNGGIYFLKKGAKTFVNYTTKNTNGGLTSDRIMNITEDSTGVIWIASFLSGLQYYNPKTKTFAHCDSELFKATGATTSDGRVVFADSKNNIWLGTTRGLFKINLKEDATFSVVSMEKKMSEKLKDHPSIHDILSIVESKEGKILVGTEGAGLFSFDPKTQEFSTFNDIEGFNEKSISSIVETNDGSIWVSGKSGITSLNLKTKATTNFTVDDGLLSNDFNDNAAWIDKNGVLYFGSYLGINYFNPNEIPVNKSEPSLYFTDFKLFNEHVIPNQENSPLKKVISETETITLSNDQSVFTIGYVGINYTRPEKNQYAYYLEGVDPDWNYVGNVRSATYTNLEAGDYIFKVKSANNDGVWNQTPLELKIRVLPPWWQTNMAYLIYTLLLIIGIVGLDLFMRNRFEQRQAIKVERSRRLQEEKLHKKKLQFFTNISHEFRTPLTLITNPLVDIINDKSLKLPLKVKEKHQIIYKNSDRLSRLINELMDFRKMQFNKIPVRAQQVNVLKQLEDIISYFEGEALQRDIMLDILETTEDFTAWLDPSMLEKIMFNLLSNAFKVTRNNGLITISVKKAEKGVVLPLVKSSQKTIEALEISVQDTGPGLDQKEYKRIFKRFYQVGKLNKSYYGSTGIGLEVVKNFVELHKGKIEVESKIGKGTKFTIILPLGKDHFSKNEILNVDGNIQFSEKEKINSLPVIEASVNEEEIEIDTNKQTLLIVEDNLELRNYLKDELKTDYKILTAANGKKGLEITKDKSPDLIITDVVMPQMDGLEMCKNIKSDIMTSHIPLLMLTARAMVDDRLEGIDSGADMYISKPFNMSILKSTLAQLITSRQILFKKYSQGISNVSKSNITTLDSAFMKKVLDYINDNICESDLSVELLASELFFSRSQLYRKIKALTGLSVSELIRNIRLEKAKELLESGTKNISEVTYMVGFSSPSYFTKCFKTKYGYSPNEITHH